MREIILKSLKQNDQEPSEILKARIQKLIDRVEKLKKEAITIGES